MKKRVFISNCEGSISKNNTVLEIASHFVPDGDRVFGVINKYCHINANFSNKKDINIAHPSKLVLPFLLAFGANNKNLEEFCADNLVLCKNSKEALNYINNISNAYILSTDYEHHVRAICREAGFPLENVYCTRVNLDKINLSEKERSKLKSLAWEIGGMPSIRIPQNAKSIKDFSSQDQATIKRLDQLFWNEIAKTSCKRLFSDVRVMSVADKAIAVQNIVASLSCTLGDVMYVGNDVSDVTAMKLVSANNGFVVSFVGEASNVRNAGAAVLSNDYAPIGVLADLFLRFGQPEASRVAGNFDKDALWLTAVEPILLDRLLALNALDWPKIYTVSEWNVETIVNKVNEFKKTIKAISMCAAA
jgi:energy-converting hydrogenase A subunit R